MPRLFWRIFFTLWLAIIVFTGLMGAISDHIARQAGVGQALEMVQQRIGQQMARLERVLQTQGPESARRNLRQVQNRWRNRVFIVDAEGRELLGRERQFRRVMRRYPKLRSRGVEVTTPRDGRYRIFLVPALPPRALLSNSPAGTLVRLGLAAALSALVSYWLARSLASPLVRLRQSSRQLAEGNLAARAGPDIARRRDEIGLLARDFDAMAERVEHLDRNRRRLLRDVSHELRSPLARLQVALELARGKDQGVVEAELDRIGLESHRLEELIDQVLDLIRDTSGKTVTHKEPLDMVELLGSIVEQVNFEAQTENHRGVMLTAPHRVPLTGDAELLLRALENIIRNAMRYTDRQKGVDVNVDASSTRVRVAVRDHGPGVPASALPHLFEAFYRVQEARDRNSGGYGLGLAIAAAAIARHHGSVNAANVAPHGLQVTVELPLDGKPRQARGSGKAST